MTVGTLYTFSDLTDTGVNDVPVGAIICINNNGYVSMIRLTSRAGLTDTSTINDVLTGGAFKHVQEGSSIVNQYYETDSTKRSITSKVVGMVWQNRVKKAGNDIMIHWHVPYRSDVQSWGGAYTDVEYSIDGGTAWVNLGNSGYDGGTMLSSASGIGSISGSTFIDIQEVRDATQIRFRFQHQGYSNNLNYVNYNHDIGSGIVDSQGIGWTTFTTEEIGR